MGFAGIIDRTSPITLARLLERIHDAGAPGKLLLTHSDTNETAVLAIDRGEIVHARCGDLDHDAVMKHLVSTFPWSYQFVAKGTQPTSDEDSAQLSIRPAKRPAIKLKPLPTSEERPAFADASPPMAPATAALVSRAPSAMPAESISAWIQGGDEHFIRFADTATERIGNVDPADWEYFRADHAWLLTTANAIRESLGFSPPITLAVVEPQRAAAYGTLENGFVGILGGKGASVSQVLQFD
jgi:hypothetical protein